MKTDTFFFPNHSLVKEPSKRNYEGYINLSSNQLEHSGYLKLISNFMSQVDPEILHQYTYINPIREKVAHYFRISSDTLAFSAGSDILIYILIDMFASHCNKIYIQTPTYMPYLDYATLKNIPICKISFAGCNYNEYFKKLKSHFTRSQDSLVIITNPNNITGEAFTLEQLDTILTICKRQRHFVILDEAYIGFSDLDHSGLLKKHLHTIAIRTLSKSCGMAGLRLAISRCHDVNVIKYLRKSGIEKSASIFSLLFYQFLLNNPDDLKIIQNEIIRERINLRNFFKKMPYCQTVSCSQTNFVSLNLKDPNTTMGLYHYLLKKKIVIKLLNSIHGLNTWVRITVGDSKKILNLTQACIEFSKDILKTQGNYD